MRTILMAAIFAIVPAIGPAIAADQCGPGCHSAQYGGCVVDGWETGARVWNECPTGGASASAVRQRLYLAQAHPGLHREMMRAAPHRA